MKFINFIYGIRQTKRKPNVYYLDLKHFQGDAVKAFHLITWNWGCEEL